MRVREMGYADYGLTSEEVKKLRELCKKNIPQVRIALYKAAYLANPDLADDLVYSLAKGLSYEKLNNITPIFACKQDFYPYRLKCLAILKGLLIADESC